MYKSKKIVVVLFVILFIGFFTSTCFAERVASPLTKVTKFQVYIDYADGDVVIWTEQNAEGCDSYWLRPSDPGFTTSVSAVLSALHAKANVQVWGYNDEKWPGSSTNVCRFALITVH